MALDLELDFFHVNDDIVLYPLYDRFSFTIWLQQSE